LSPNAEERQVRVSRLWAMAPPSLLGISPPAVVHVTGQLEPPWPDVLVTCGRRSALVAMAIRRRNPAPMVAVHIQPPNYPKAFDLVVAMAHDRLHGPNVMRVDTALHGVTPAALAAATAQADPRFSTLPRPWTGVLLGGSTRRKPFRYEDALRLADQLDALRREFGGSLLITPSRRTPPAVLAALSWRYASDLTVRIWDGELPNPYLSILAQADGLVVTSDSVSMISEALATTAPVLMFRLPGGRRHAFFVDNLIAKGLVVPLDASPRLQRRAAVDAMPSVFASVRRLLPDNLRSLLDQTSR
jgi:mitochondrial fission protein ELM1